MHFNLADMFEAVADAVPNRIALVCGNHSATFKQLELRSNQLAHYLSAQGIQPGDHVGLYLHNCNEYLEAMMACFKLRAVPVNINYRYVDDELLYIFNNADLKACVHHAEFAPTIARVLAMAPLIKTLLAVDDASEASIDAINSQDYESCLEASSPARHVIERSDDDIFLLYTGGTTGMPKGVMWTHKAVFFAAMGGAGYFHPDGAISKPEEIVSRITEHSIANMALAPLMHGACWWSACIQLLAGNKLVLNPNRSLDGEQVWDIVELEKVNILTIVGDAIAIPLLDALERNPGRWDLSSVFSISSGGAVFSAAKQEGFRKHFPQLVIANAFGSSESGAMGADSNARKTGDEGLGSVPKSEFMSVIVSDKIPRHAKPGEQGIFARSGHIPLGYYKDDKKTAEAFIVIDGERWLLTGDSARLGDDGLITIYGRGSNCINSGGEKIFPEEVEEALKSHDGVQDVLVVGLQDERWGNRVVAVVQPRQGSAFSLEDLQEHCRQYIASYKVPRELHFIDEIPRAPSGKPNYPKAKEIAESGQFAASG